VIAELKDAKAALAQLGAAAEKKFELKTPKVRAYARTHRHTQRERRTDIVIVRCKHVYASPLGASAYPCIGECALYPRIRGVGPGRKWLSLSPSPHGSPRRALSCLSRWCAMCRGLGLCDCVCVYVSVCVRGCVCVTDAAVGWSAMGHRARETMGRSRWLCVKRRLRLSPACLSATAR
jgi:hypothetical protein